MTIPVSAPDNNLILLDFFVYGRRFEPFYERARQAKEKKP